MGMVFNVLCVFVVGFSVCCVKCQETASVLFLFISAPSPTELILKWGPPEGISDLKHYILKSRDTLGTFSFDKITLRSDVLAYNMKGLVANCNYTIQLSWEGRLNNGTPIERVVIPMELYEKSLQKRRQIPATLIFYVCIASSSGVYVIVVVVLLVYYCKRRHRLLCASGTVDITALSRDKPLFNDTSERYSTTEPLQLNRVSTFNGGRINRINIISEDENAYAEPKQPSKSHQSELENSPETVGYANDPKDPKYMNPIHGYQQISESGYIQMVKGSQSSVAPSPAPERKPPPVPDGPYAEVTEAIVSNIAPEGTGELRDYETPMKSRSAVPECGYISMGGGACQKRSASLRRAQSTNEPPRTPTITVRRNESMKPLIGHDWGTSKESVITDKSDADMTINTDIHEFATSCPVVAPMGLFSNAEEGFEITLTLRSTAKH